MTVGSRVAARTAEDMGLLTSSQVCHQAGLTYRQLDHWTRRGLVVPAVAAAGAGTARLWSPSVVGQVVELLERIDACPFKHD